MTLIEGIGDEVIHFFFLLAIILIAIIAWWSTYISERPLLRTVLILERHATRHTVIDNQATLDSRDTAEVAAERNEPEQEEKTSQAVNESCNQLEMNIAEHDDNFLVNSDEIQNTIRSLNGTSNPIGPEECDGSSANTNTTNESEVVRNRRITFFQNKEDSPKTQCKSKTERTGEESSVSGECGEHSSDDGNIRIRLKYLNDDLKLVEGRLHEQLGDFKRRHFSLELDGRKLVRLIFNGKVLQQDTKTLQNYGLFDNCVVHCLVHQPRTPPPSPSLNRPRAEAQSQNDVGDHLDLGVFLFWGSIIFLSINWYGRYEYWVFYMSTSAGVLIVIGGIFIAVLARANRDFQAT